MKAKFYGQTESKEYTPRPASEQEVQLIQDYLNLREKARLCYEQMDQILTKLPIQDPIAFKATIYENGDETHPMTTFYVDRPEWLHVRAKQLDLEFRPTTKEDKKTLGIVD